MELKSRTECTSCRKTGHWKYDDECTNAEKDRAERDRTRGANTATPTTGPPAEIRRVRMETPNPSTTRVSTSFAVTPMLSDFDTPYPYEHVPACDARESKQEPVKSFAATHHCAFRVTAKGLGVNSGRLPPKAESSYKIAQPKQNRHLSQLAQSSQITYVSWPLTSSHGYKPHQQQQPQPQPQPGTDDRPLRSDLFVLCEGGCGG